MGAWWISWIDFPFSCRKIYILLTCYITVTEARKQVKCIRWTWLPCFFFLRKILIIHGRSLIPVSEWWSGLSGGLDYDWAGQAPPAAPLIVDAIRSDKYWDPDTFTLHIMDWWPGPPSSREGWSLSSSIIVVGTGPGSRVGVDGCWVRSVSCISRD